MRLIDAVGARSLAALHDQSAFGDILSQVPAAFEVAGNLHRRDDVAQIHCDRLAQSDHPHSSALYIGFGDIELRIAIDHLFGDISLAADNGGDRVPRLGHGQFAHVIDLVL